jgi:hypothetical protein
MTPSVSLHSNFCVELDATGRPAELGPPSCTVVYAQI